MSGPQQWCGGPAHVAVGLGPGGQPAYLGTTEGSPKFSHHKFFQDTKNDWAGDLQPFDKMYAGQIAMVSGDFTRFDNSLFQKMMSCPNPFATPGLNRGGDLGTFMIQEGMAYQLMLQSPYASAKNSMRGLETGLRYFAAFLMGPDEKTLGLRPQKARCIWFCMPIFSPDTNNTVQELLYDFNTQSFPQIS